MTIYCLRTKIVLCDRAIKSSIITKLLLSLITSFIISSFYDNFILINLETRCMGRHAYTMGQLWGVMTDLVGGVMAMGRHDRVPKG